jgi:hypothetical protein
MNHKGLFVILPIISVLLGALPSFVFAQSDQPTCPDGYSLSSDGTTCTLNQQQQQQQQSQPTCPSGYSLSSDQTKCILDKQSLDLSPLIGPAISLGCKALLHLPC